MNNEVYFFSNYTRLANYISEHKFDCMTHFKFKCEFIYSIQFSTCVKY